MKLMLHIMDLKYYAATKFQVIIFNFDGVIAVQSFIIFCKNISNTIYVFQLQVMDSFEIYTVYSSLLLSLYILSLNETPLEVEVIVAWALAIQSYPFIAAHHQFSPQLS